MSDITLSAGIRANLLSLQQTADLMSTTQNRLATGKKVNSALDNPLNYFQSSSLSARANDLSGLLDTMSSGISTIQAANNGITAITSLVQQLKATVQQARSDATGAATTAGTATAAANNSTLSNNSVKFDLGGGTTVSVNTYTHVNATVSTLKGTSSVDGTTDYSGGLATGQLTIADGTTTADIDMTAIDGTGTQQDVVDAVNAGLQSAGSTVQAQLVGGKVSLTNNTGKTITVGGTGAAGLGFGAGNTASTDGSQAVNTPVTLSALADAINANSSLVGKVTASVSGGTLTFKNLTSSAVSVTGYDGTNITGNSANSSNIAAAGGGTISSVRQSLMNQFNDLLSQIDGAVKDAGYNGINLLNGDQLKLNFNENGTSSISIQSKDASNNPFALSSSSLGFSTATTGQFNNNGQLDTLSDSIATALTTLRTQASSLGSSLSVVQTRQDFTKSMVNTLQTGADNLVLADTNEEGANLLALQTRQSLSTTALSLSAQADQNVLRLFG